jgi:hypothetical protein
MRGTVRHGPYLARFTTKHLVFVGEYKDDKKVGDWTVWTSLGRLLRIEEHGDTGDEARSINTIICR